MEARSLKATISDNENLPKGINRRRMLPDAGLGALWDSIVINAALKEQLLSQSVLNFSARGRIDRSIIPLHGVILLVGQPGTGKTSLARGLAHRTATSFANSKFQLLEVEPHALTSSAMGKTQKAVSELFSQSIAEAAVGRPTIVLLDEVETLAADRSRMSLEANPVDIHRATDAVLVQLDLLAEQNPNLLFIATSNFPQAVDSAFLSRCDLIAEIPLPDGDACRAILKDCLLGLGKTFRPIAALSASHGFETCAAECVGLDGRAIRKMVANALASTPQTAMNPDALTIEHLIGAARAAKAVRASGGKKS